MISEFATARKIVQGQLDFSINDSDRLRQALDQIGWTHDDNDDGWVTIGIKPTGEKISWSQYHVRAVELAETINHFMAVPNVYFSQNSFYIPRRLSTNVRHFNALFVDMDYYKVDSLRDFLPEQIIGQLEDNFFGEYVPKPNFVLCSGRGLTLIWMIEAVPQAALPLWQVIERYFISQLSELGSDPLSGDASRVLRLAGTINSKNGEMAKILRVYDVQRKYTLREIQSEWLPELKPRNKDKKQASRRPRKTSENYYHIFTIYSLHAARLIDIKTLQELRTQAGDDCDGRREMMCFLYRYWVCCFRDDDKGSLEETLEFNSRFLKPLPEVEIKQDTASAVTAWKEWQKNFDNKGKLVGCPTQGKKLKEQWYSLAGYNYKTGTLIKLLNITDEEQKQMETLIGTREKYDRKNRERNARLRNECGLTPKQQQMENRLQSLRYLLREDKTQQEIADIMGVSTRTIRNYMKSIKNQ